ncbi:MAG: hypothetical protein QXE31_02015 [Candidatus Woesearchaeota archaeon]
MKKRGNLINNLINFVLNIITLLNINLFFNQSFFYSLIKKIFKLNRLFIFLTFIILHSFLINAFLNQSTIFNNQSKDIIKDSLENYITKTSLLISINNTIQKIRNLGYNAYIFNDLYNELFLIDDSDTSSINNLYLIYKETETNYNYSINLLNIHKNNLKYLKSIQNNENNPFCDITLLKNIQEYENTIYIAENKIKNSLYYDAINILTTLNNELNPFIENYLNNLTSILNKNNIKDNYEVLEFINEYYTSDKEKNFVKNLILKLDNTNSNFKTKYFISDESIVIFNYIFGEEKNKIQRIKNNDILKYNIKEISEVCNEISYINYVLSKYIEISIYNDYLFKNNISNNLLNDLKNEIIYYLQKNRLDRIETLLQDTNKIIEKIKSFEIRYNNLKIEINELKSKNITDFDSNKEIIQQTQIFSQELENIYEEYKKFELDKANNKLIELENQLISYKSRLIETKIRQKNFLKINFKILFLIFILSITLFIISYPTLKTYYKKKRITYLESRKKAIIEQIKQLQRDYFIDKKLSRKRYKQLLKINQTKLIEIIRNLEILNK